MAVKKGQNGMKKCLACEGKHFNFKDCCLCGGTKVIHPHLQNKWPRAGAKHNDIAMIDRLDKTVDSLEKIIEIIERVERKYRAI